MAMHGSFNSHWGYDMAGRQLQNLCEFVEMAVFEDASYLWPQYNLVAWFFFTYSKSQHAGLSESVNIEGDQWKKTQHLYFNGVMQSMSEGENKIWVREIFVSCKSVLLQILLWPQ